MSEVKTRQPMCPGGKIQLPKINRDFSVVNRKIVSSTVTMNGSINSNDLCYNRCPNGEAPQPDKMSGNYFCLVPSLVTYQIKQNPKEGTVTNDVNGIETKIQKPDEIDYSKSYTVSCQSTDIMDFSTPQTGNTNNTMFGTPIQIISGLYENPLGPNDLRSSNYDASGEYKWFCKRPMYGAPPLGALQSAYEAINPDIIKASENIPAECESAVDMSSISGSTSISSLSGSKNTALCSPKNLNEKAAIGISNGIQIVEQTQTTQIPTANPLNIVQSVHDNKIPVPNTITQINADTGAVTIMPNNNYGVSANIRTNTGDLVVRKLYPAYCNTAEKANNPECK